MPDHTATRPPPPPPPVVAVLAPPLALIEAPGAALNAPARTKTVPPEPPPPYASCPLAVSAPASSAFRVTRIQMAPPPFPPGGLSRLPPELPA